MFRRPPPTPRQSKPVATVAAAETKITSLELDLSSIAGARASRKAALNARGVTSSALERTSLGAERGKQPFADSNRANLVHEDSWQCPLCSKRNGQVQRCACCGRARETATSAASRLWAGPSPVSSSETKNASSGGEIRRGKPPPPPPKPPITGYDPDGTTHQLDDEEKKRRLEYYRRRPPPPRRQAPKKKLPPRPSGPPPPHALVSKQHAAAHSIESKHYTSHFHDAEQHAPLSLKERERSLRHGSRLQRRVRAGLGDGVALSELCSISGVPCAVTVVQREWRAIVHAVDLERGDEYSASSELHARYVHAAAPSDAQKFSLYRELVSACAFKSTPAAKGDLRRRLVVNAPESQDSQLAKFTKAQADDEAQTRERSLKKQQVFVVLSDERLLVGETLMHASAAVRDPPAVVEVQLEDKVAHLKSSLSFPLGAAVGLAAILLKNRKRQDDRTTELLRVVPAIGYTFEGENSHSSSPWASSAAKRAPSKSALGARVLLPSAYRLQIAMAVEFICSELTSCVVEENMKTVLRITPSASLVAAIADACRHHRAAVVVQAAWRCTAAKRRASARKRTTNNFGLVKMQAYWRGKVTRRQFSSERRLVCRERIRAAWRKHAARTKRAKHDATTRINNRSRVFLARRRLQEMRVIERDATEARRVTTVAAANERERLREEARISALRRTQAQREIQRWARCAMAKKVAIREARLKLDQRRKRKAALMVTRLARGWLGRRRAKRFRVYCENQAAARIQTTWRRCAAISKARYLQDKRARQSASSRIAKAWTHFMERREARQVREENRNEILLRAAEVVVEATDADNRARSRENFIEQKRRKMQRERAIATVLANRAASNATIAAREAITKAMRAARVARDSNRNQAATRIANAHRRRMIHKKVVETKMTKHRKMTVVRLQCALRQSLAKQRVVIARKRKDAVIMIQKLVRGKRGRLRVDLIRAGRSKVAAVKIQSMVRTVPARRMFKRGLAATRIQTLWRRVAARTRASVCRAQRQAETDAMEVKANEDAWRAWAARSIQTWWRDLVAKKAAENEAAWIEWATAIIQAWWRDRRQYRLDKAEQLPQQSPIAEPDNEEEESDSDGEPFEFNPEDRRDVHEAFQWARHGRKDKLRKFCEGGFDVSVVSNLSSMIYSFRLTCEMSLIRRWQWSPRKTTAKVC